MTQKWLLVIALALVLAGCQGHQQAKKQYLDDAGAVFMMHDRLLKADSNDFLGGKVDGTLKLIRLATARFEGANKGSAMDKKLGFVATFARLQKEAAAYIEIREDQAMYNPPVTQKQVDKVANVYKNDLKKAKQEYEKAKHS